MKTEIPPLRIIILAKLIPILKWEGEDNLAQGEIIKFNSVNEDWKKRKFNEQFVGLQDGFDFIWRHISDGRFKVVGKTPERSC